MQGGQKKSQHFKHFYVYDVYQRNQRHVFPPLRFVFPLPSYRKENVWCALVNVKVTGPFLFHEVTPTSSVFLDTLENYVMSQIQ